MNEHLPPIRKIDENNFDEWFSAVQRSTETAMQAAMDRENARENALVVEIQSLPERQQHELLMSYTKRQTALHETAERLAMMRASLTTPYDRLIARAHRIVEASGNRDVNVDELSVQENRALQQHQGIARAERAVALELCDVERELEICVAVINGLRLQTPAEA